MKALNKKQIYLIGIIILVVAVAVIFLLQGLNIDKKSSSANEIQSNKEQIECYNNLLYFLLSGQNISSDQLNVQSVRCSSQFPYSQYELNGTYFEDANHDISKHIYFYEIRGGMAPSGADGYYEVCLIIGDEIIKSGIWTGSKSNYQGESRCSWQKTLPVR
jgi:hypothetical protein